MAFKSATDPFNFSNWENFYYQKLLKVAAHETDPLKRDVRIKELEKILIEDACVLPLFHGEIRPKTPPLKEVNESFKD